MSLCLNQIGLGNTMKHLLTQNPCWIGGCLCQFLATMPGQKSGPKRNRDENLEAGMEWRNSRGASGRHQPRQQWAYAQQWPQDQQWQDDDHQWSGQQWPADHEWSGQHWGHQWWSGPEQSNGGKQKLSCPRLSLKWQTCLRELPGTTQKHSGLT